MKKQPYTKENRVILNAINLEGYDEYAKLMTEKQKLIALHAVFMSEVGKWRIPQAGLFVALQDWLQGLPTALTLPFYNCDILNLAHKTGALPAKATERQEDTILAKYWPFMGMRLLGLWRQAGIKV